MTKAKEQQKLNFLKTFTTDEVSRFVLNTPNYANGYFEAANGHFACRIKAEHLPNQEQETREKFPNMQRLLQLATGEPKTINLKELKPTATQLKLLTVKPNTKETCGECDGDGVLTCDLDHKHDCEDCDGYGEVDAKPEVGYVEALGRHWNYQYFGALFTAAELFGYECTAKTTDQGDMHIFEFDGAEVLIMPLRDGQCFDYICLGDGDVVFVKDAA